jgi:hypothetical protein
VPERHDGAFAPGVVDVELAERSRDAHGEGAYSVRRGAVTPIVLLRTRALEERRPGVVA